MSKADTVAFEYAKENGTVGLEYNQIYDAVKHGYHQAEKDLEMGWEQIYSILYFEREVLREFGYEEHSNEEVCTEILKRFKAQKDE